MAAVPVVPALASDEECRFQAKLIVAYSAMTPEQRVDFLAFVQALFNEQREEAALLAEKMGSRDVADGLRLSV